MGEASMGRAASSAARSKAPRRAALHASSLRASAGLAARKRSANVGGRQAVRRRAPSMRMKSSTASGGRRAAAGTSMCSAWATKSSMSSEARSTGSAASQRGNGVSPTCGDALRGAGCGGRAALARRRLLCHWLCV